MTDSVGFIHSVLAPVLTKIVREERPRWDQSRRKQDPAQSKSNLDPVQETIPQDEGNPGETTSSTHIDLRI